jgi:lipopolysaccharide export system permease protein
MGKTLRRYLVAQIGGAFLAGLLIFTSILFLMKVLALIEMIFSRGVPMALVLRLLAAILPSFLEATLPMAFLLGIVLALGRMAADHETLALRAAGIAIWQLLPPILGCALLVSAATLTLSMTARPWGHREIERTAFEIAKTRASAALKPRFFNTDFERMVVYVDRIEPETGELVGVLLSDERGSGGRATVFARRGRIGGHEDSGDLFMQLLDGTTVAARESSADYDVTRFRSLEVHVELRTATGARPLSDEPAALTWTDMQSDIAGNDTSRAREATIEMHRRFSIAAASVVLALLGAALGFHPSHAARGRAVAFSIGAILVFHGLLTLAVAIARSGSVAPSLALWMPDAALAAIALWALARSSRDRAAFPLVFAPLRGSAAFTLRRAARASQTLRKGETLS